MVNYNCGMPPKNTIKIIQGDTFQRTFTIRLTGGDKLPDAVIGGIYFTCAKLGIIGDDKRKELIPKVDPKNPTRVMPGFYMLSFTSDETSGFTKCSATYDITIEFKKIDPSSGTPKVVKTLRYQYPIEVLPKTNYVYDNK